MNKQTLYMGLLGLTLTAGACSTHYGMTGIERSRVVVDSRYDARPDLGAARFVAPYQVRVDSMMKPVVGRVARYMAAHKPESELSNLLADILLWGGTRYGERPDFAVYNMGGMRAAFAEGPVTLGAILDVAPFENKISFLTLSGDKTLELMRQIAARGGEGVSRGVQLRIGRDGRLVEAKVGGQPIDPARSYRVATLDYLAQGNDQLTAFKAKTDVREGKEKCDNVREIIAEYFKADAAKGIVTDSRVEGRITIEE